MSLCDLPLEIRNTIYAFLTPEAKVLSPLKLADIQSVSHRPPPLALLLTSKWIHDEVIASYMSRARWIINIRFSFDFFRQDPDLEHLTRLRMLLYMQRVELWIEMTDALLYAYPGLTPRAYSKELQRRCAKACRALSGSAALKTLTVSFRDSTDFQDWRVKEPILFPLTLVPKRVAIRPGCIVSLDDEQTANFILGIDRCSVRPD